MTRGKPWSVDEEKQLKALVEAKTPLSVIAEKLSKSPDAVSKKCRRLKLEVVDAKGYRTTTSISMPKELPSVEETLKMLAGALKASCKSGLDKVEVQRLQVVATLARTYEDVLARYVNYRGIEAKLVKMEENYERLLGEKSKDVASKKNDAAFRAS